MACKPLGPIPATDKRATMRPATPSDAPRTDGPVVFCPDCGSLEWWLDLNTFDPEVSECDDCGFACSLDEVVDLLARRWQF